MMSRLADKVPDGPTLKIANIQTNGWTWLGPGNIGGRVRSILIHPTLTDILWCGSVSGGVWKSTNGGASWFPLNDFMANLAVACMAMDPTNADVIYVGTGKAQPLPSRSSRGGHLQNWRRRRNLDTTVFDSQFIVSICESPGH